VTYTAEHIPRAAVMPRGTGTG